MNYRKYYERKNNKQIPKDWDVHHIDFNHDNNEIKNLIAIPKVLHVFIHKDIGYCDRNEIEKMLKTLKDNKGYKDLK